MKQMHKKKDFLLDFPVLVSFSLIHVYQEKPLIEVLENVQSRMVAKAESRELWKTQIDKIYQPLLEFLNYHSIQFSAVVTGNFLDFVAKERPKCLKLLQQMMKKGIVHLVADAYWGTSHLGVFYVDWWRDEVDGTRGSIKKHLGVEVDSAFLPMVYRALPLEKVTGTSNIRRFISIRNKRKSVYYPTNLIDFRRYHGGKVHWITEEENVDIEIIWYPMKNTFDLMDIKTATNPESLVKTRSMEIGLRSSRAQSEVRSPSIQSKSVRVAEERHFSGYHPLIQATFRLWEQGTFILGKEHAEVDNIDDDALMRNLFYMINRDFLFYLNPSNYSKKRDIPFSSPYEAFVHVQNVIFQLELLLDRRG